MALSTILKECGAKHAASAVSPRDAGDINSSFSRHACTNTVIKLKKAFGEAKKRGYGRGGAADGLWPVPIMLLLLTARFSRQRFNHALIEHRMRLGAVERLVTEKNVTKNIWVSS